MDQDSLAHCVLRHHIGDLDRRICAHVRDFEMGTSGGQCGVRVDPDPGTDLAHEAVRRGECRAGSGPSRGVSLNVASAANASIGAPPLPDTPLESYPSAE